MLKNILSFLALLWLTQASGESLPYEITRFETPIQIGATGYLGAIPETDWALPLLARKAMRSLSYNEWKQHWSEGFFVKTKIDQDRFLSIQSSSPVPAEVIWSVFAEVRVSHEGADYILLYGCAAPRSEFPATEEELGAMVSTDFFRFENGKWINWTVPHDMDFSAPITKLIDYREVMGFK